LGRVTVAALDETATDPGSRPYVDQVARRFAKSYTAGAPVDVQGMSARLNAISYDLPVTLEAALRQPDAANIDVVINMRLLASEPGRVSGGVVQLNNHGLEAYGRAQVLTQVRVQGEAPLTEYGVVAQASQGVSYLSANRTAAIEGWQSRSNLSASASRTQTKIDGVSVKSNTQVLGGGVTSLIRWQSHWHVVRQSWPFFQNDFAGRIANRVMQTSNAVRESVVSSIVSMSRRLRACCSEDVPMVLKR
jgi:hypothetical protein